MIDIIVIVAELVAMVIIIIMVIVVNDMRKNKNNNAFPRKGSLPDWAETRFAGARGDSLEPGRRSRMRPDN